MTTNDNTSSIEEASNNDGENTKNNKLDKILSTLTSAFPFFVLGSALSGTYAPGTLNWVNKSPNLIPNMLATVMLTTGMTLEPEDFTQIFSDQKKRQSIPIGVLCQYMIMPITAFMVGNHFFLKNMAMTAAETTKKSLYLGLILVGCSPGGTASNLVSLIANADVALSVLLTTCSTLLASIVTPILVKFLVGSTIEVSGLKLCIATSKVVLLPVVIGMILNQYFPKQSKEVSRYTPFASVVLVALICGGVVAQNAASASTSASAAIIGISTVLKAVISLHLIGFMCGYLIPRHVLKMQEQTSRTISIETGMQNSVLAVVLAGSISGADAIASLPGALSATAHSCIGSILAAFWRMKERSNDADD